MHADAYAFVASAVRLYGVQAPVYEIGARNINGTIRGLFPALGYLGVDIWPGPGVDLVVDASAWDAPGPFGTAVCCEVLEHTSAAPEIMARAGGALHPGGLLIVTCAGEGRARHSARDGGPLADSGEYYQNRTIADLTGWAAAAGVEALPVPWRVVPGDVYFVGRKR